MQTRKLNINIAALIISIGGFLLGFGGAVISGATPFYSIDFGLPDSPWLIGFSVSSIVLGSIAGNFIAGSLSNRFGRRGALFISAVFFIVSAVGSALATGITFFILTRIIGGVAVGIAILAAPMLISELSPYEKRGKLVSFNQLNIVLGVSIAYFSNFVILNSIEDGSTAWRIMMGVLLIPSILYFFLLFLVPESPRWLLLRHQKEKALNALLRVGERDAAEHEIKAIQESLKQESGSSEGKFKDLFQHQFKLVIIVGLALAFFQQVSGINAIFYYAPMIFGLAGVGQDSAFFQAIIVGVANVGVTLIAMSLIDRVGRKPLLLLGSTIMAVSLFVAAYSFFNAKFTITEGTIAQLEKHIVKKAVVDHLVKTDMEFLKTDSLDIASDQVGVFIEGNKVTSLSTSQPEIQQALLEAAFVSEALHQFKGITIKSELIFFDKIKGRVISDLSSHLAHNGNNRGEYAYKSFVKNDHSFASSDLAKSIVEQKFPEYKSIILGSSIQIHSIFVLLAIIGFITGFSLSLGPVTWTMLAEIFPNQIRVVAISFAGTFNALTSFIVATVFPVELERFGSGMTFLIYALFMVLCLIFVILAVPETKGKSLEQLEKELIKK